MAETKNLRLELLEAMQSSKHITVNEALSRVDSIVGATVISKKYPSPPVVVSAGDCYIVSTPSEGVWRGKDQSIAYFENGRWSFVEPKNGWSMWVEETSSSVTFFDGKWHSGLKISGLFGSETNNDIIIFEHEIKNEFNSITDVRISDKSIVLGVTGVVIEQIVGPEFWSLGVQGSHDRYGGQHSCQVGAKISGLTSSPLTYFGETSLVLSGGGGGMFLRGRVRMAIHAMQLSAPDI